MNKPMIEAYIEEVIKRVRKNEQEDLKEELRSLIEAEHLDQDKATETVLSELGDPKALAQQYGAKEKSFIGPTYYESYLMTLQIAALAISIAMIVASIVGFVFDGEFSILTLFSSWFGALLHGFAFVTIAFMLTEHFLEKDYKIAPWKPSDLKLSEHAYKSISRVDAGFQIAFMLVILVIVNGYYDLIAIYAFSEGMNKVSLLNQALPQTIGILLNLGLLMVLASGILKAVLGRYTPLYTMINGVLGLLSTLFIGIVLLSQTLYNPTLNEELALIGFGNELDWFGVVNRIGTILTIVLIFTYLFGFANDLFKSRLISSKFLLKFHKKNKTS